MKTKLFAIAAFTAGAALSASAGLVDLSTTTSGEINGAIFRQSSTQPTGTGVIAPFLRLQANGNEGAYNTSGDLDDPFAQTSGSDPWNDDLLLTGISQVMIDGTSYYQFLLDVNESGNTGQDNAKITLNQVQIYQTSVAGQEGGTIDPLTGRFETSGTGVTPFTGTLVYDMNSGGGTANSVILDYGLGAGSGSGDMYMNIPVSLFDQNANPYVVLYSHFGAPPGTFASDAGFEGWAVQTPIPEPGTVVAGALLLLPFTASMFRRFRRN